MSPEILFEAIGRIDEPFVAEALQTPKRRPVWLNLAYVAACLALAMAAGVMAYSYSRPSTPPVTDAPSVYGESAFDVTPATTTTEYPFITTVPNAAKRPDPYVVVYPEERVVAEEHTSPRDLACYARGPYPGECWIDVYGPHIVAQTDPNTVYWVELSLSNENGRIFTGDEIYDEARRLANLGYEIYLKETYWMGYWGEQKHVTHLCGYFTKEHLEYFPIDPSLGYLIDYCREDVAECQRVLPHSSVRTSSGETWDIVMYPELADTFGYDELVNKDDFSHLYIDAVRRLLAMMKQDAVFESERNSDVLYLDTDGVTQTPCDLLVSDIQSYASVEYSLTVDACTREQAEEKGYIQCVGGHTVAHSVWVIVKDTRVDADTIQANLCLYAGDRAAYFVDLTLKQQNNEWTVTEMKSGLS